ncbi:MAG TPA: toll/interleukin-1 receptor domain-containing protein [Candidatus Acidoferrales bacterium]|nr:toll/interleukin-1 receptor domain-containing protein [Candidatus Acidoferrales bacterium]
MADTCEITRQVARIVARGLAAGNVVEIDGLGTFYPDARRGLRFEPQSSPSVFLAYVKEDEDEAARLYSEFAAAGFSPWMDVCKLLPGQNWPRAIEGAIETSDFFVACFSSRSVRKRGGFQAEIRYALDCARQVPLDQIFLVPVRLDACDVPRAVQAEFQWIDLFPDWPRGAALLKAMMRREMARRKSVRPIWP